MVRKFFRWLLGYRLIVVGVQWDKGEVIIEQEIDVTVEGDKEKRKEKIKKITLGKDRVIVDTEFRRAIHFIKEFKNISYDKEWRIK